MRYAKDITIHVALQEDTGNGLIYPPYIQINYGVATSDNYDASSSVAVSCFFNIVLNVVKSV